MSLATRAVNRLRKLYTNIWRRNSIANAQAAAYSCNLHSLSDCALTEHLEPRLMLSGTPCAVADPLQEAVADNLLQSSEVICIANSQMDAPAANAASDSVAANVNELTAGTEISEGQPLTPLTAAVDPSILSYRVESDDTITITDCPEDAAGELIIPDTIEGKPVTAIGDDAFAWCDALTSVTIPDSVTTIGDYVFFWCDSLVNINVSAENTTYTSHNGVLFNKAMTTLIQYPPGKFGDYTIPDSVTTIGDYGFNECYNLTSVTLGSSVTTIGYFAFYSCDALTSVTIPDSVTAIDYYAFTNCDALTSVTLGSSVTTIGGWAFCGCESLTSVVIPDSVTIICNSAFAHCDSLTIVTIGDSVTTIEYTAFSDCDALTSVTFEGDAPTYFADNVFDDIASEFTIYFYEGASGFTTPIWRGYACEMIAAPLMPGDSNGDGSVNLDDFITLKQNYGVSSGATWSMGDFNDDGCVNLDDFILLKQNYGQSSTAIGGTIATDAASDSVAVVVNDLTAGIDVSEGQPLTPLTAAVDPSILSYRVESDDTITITDCPEDAAGELVIPDTIEGKPVTTIGNSAFRDCDSLTSVTIPDSVTTIGNSAFYDCDPLASVVIGDSVTTIGHDAFYSCSSLTSVTFGNSVTTIGDWAFYYCYSLTNLTLGDSVTMIEDSAFSHCYSLTSVMFEGDVPPSFGENVFYGTASKFTIYFYEGAGGFINMPYACEMIAAGDANGDGSVNLDDFITLKQNYGVSSGATWSMGDFNDDDSVNLDDFILLKQNYG